MYGTLRGALAGRKIEFDRDSYKALEIHPQGCPAHQSVKDAITISWSATVRAGEQVLTLHEHRGPARSA
jgi:hypothetical protein